MDYNADSELLTEKVILVTGAAKGIGAAVATIYAKHGATVILLDKNIAALETTYDQIIVNSPAATPALYPLDLKGATVEDYRQLVTTISDNFGRLDGLVHCAASLGQLAPVEHQDTKAWMETLHINLTAPYLLTKECLFLMQKSEQSSIIFTSDNNKDKAYWAAYGVAKSGIESLSKQLADELEAEGRIRVNCVDTGKVKTELHARAFPGIDPSNLVSADEVTACYLYLMGQDSVNTTGTLVQAQ